MIAMIMNRSLASLLNVALLGACHLPLPELGDRGAPPSDMRSDRARDGSLDSHPVRELGVADSTPPTADQIVCSATCAGCCSGNSCLPLASQSHTQCGKGGQTCITCGGASSCIDGECIEPSPCGACDDGCCEGTVCIPYAQQSNTRCGHLNNPCKDCTTKAPGYQQCCKIGTWMTCYQC